MATYIRVATIPGRPSKTLDFVCPWKTLKLQPTPENLCSGANFPCLNFWPCGAFAFFTPVTQGKRIYAITDTKFQAKTQNERWIGTGRRSICDNSIFRKHSQKYPGKPLNLGRKSAGKPWKRNSSHCWPPSICILKVILHSMHFENRMCGRIVVG